MMSFNVGDELRSPPNFVPIPVVIPIGIELEPSHIDPANSFIKLPHEHIFVHGFYIDKVN